MSENDTTTAATEADPRPRCDHICLRSADHVDRGVPHFYGYEIPSPRARAAAVDTTTDLGILLADLWSAERCAWHMDFDGSAGASDPWLVVLEWTQESGNAHDADWVTFTWQFYGRGAEEALQEALDWCRGLVPFERCPGCDGDGSYGALDARKTCEDCDGTGLAHREAVSA